MNRSIEIYQSRIDKVIDHINNNLDRSISVDELAAVAFFSSFHFHRIFVAITGETVSSFVNRLRNEKAARLLRFSKKTISAVSTECGFSSASTLSRSFREYFKISPREYRNGVEIKDSKIRKEFFPVNTYHCHMTQEELRKSFPVEIKKLPQRRIAYIRVMDAFREGVVIKAFEQMVQWAKKMGLFDSEDIFGMSIDDPEVTPKEKYRYEVCITIPRELKIDPDGLIKEATIPECRYAATVVSGDLHSVGAAFNYLFDNWLINSSYECEAQHAMELFLDKDNICNWDHFDLQLFIPIRALMAH